MTLTPEELSEIEARCSAATPGPWEIDSKGINGKIDSIGPLCGYDFDSLEVNNDDATFIAHARSDVPRLIAAIRERDAGLEVGKLAVEFCLDMLSSGALFNQEQFHLTEKGHKTLLEIAETSKSWIKT